MGLYLQIGRGLRSEAWIIFERFFWLKDESSSESFWRLQGENTSVVQLESGVAGET